MAWLITNKDQIEACLGPQPRIAELETLGVAPALYCRVGNIQQTRAGGHDLLAVQLLFYLGEQHYLADQQPFEQHVVFGKEKTVFAVEVKDATNGTVLRQEVSLPPFSELVAKTLNAQVATLGELLTLNKSAVYAVLNQYHPLLRSAQQV